jgi:carotenoid cleavage dioxygenase-like enzyme
MTPTRRTLFMGAAALSGALAAARVLAPDRAYALQALAATADWSLATADVEGDIAPRALRLVRGRAPQGLSGSLYRNGPAKFRRPGGSSQHWFDGDGLIRRWRIEDGQADLAARFADTRKRRQEAEVGAMLMPGFGTVGDPRARIGSADDASPANTSVHKVGGRLWALWEAGSPLAMDPETLATETSSPASRPEEHALPGPSAHRTGRPHLEPGRERRSRPWSGAWRRTGRWRTPR